MGLQRAIGSEGKQLTQRVMTVADHNIEPPSALVRALACDPRDELQITDIMALLGDRALAAAMLVFALPILAPLPPGSNFVLGVPLLLITAQLMVGRRTLWLPERVGRKRVRLDASRKFLLKAADRLAWLERFVKPRHEWFCMPRADRLIGAVCFLLALLLFLPIPFASIVPALALSFFALGLVKRDGILIAGGWLVVILAAVATQLMTMALAQHAPALISTLTGGLFGS